MQPVIESGLYSTANVNVEQQRRDPDSLLRWTARMIRTRKECPEIGWGTWEIVPTRPASVLAIQYSWRGTSLLCMHNLAPRPVEVAVQPEGEGRRTLANVMTDEVSEAGRDGVHSVDLEAYGYRWYRVGGLRYAIEREAGEHR